MIRLRRVGVVVRRRAIDKNAALAGGKRHEMDPTYENDGVLNCIG